MTENYSKVNKGPWFCFLVVVIVFLIRLIDYGLEAHQGKGKQCFVSWLGMGERQDGGGEGAGWDCSKELRASMTSLPGRWWLGQPAKFLVVMWGEVRLY